ncbi:BPSL0761 family protein [Paraburkholderia sp. MM5477-R1]|uniref:BPSL0761 family protein n=1 Tax=Paraburkholderia sp. MM5477-R1 TaxID=2991062 RepID=UPI003D1A118B
MTTPEERTKAVVETGEFLRMLVVTDSLAISPQVKDLANKLLRHYPLDVDIGVSAAALPGVWAHPKHGR